MISKAAELSEKGKNENLGWHQCPCHLCSEGSLSPWSVFGIRHGLKKFHQNTEMQNC